MRGNQHLYENTTHTKQSGRCAEINTSIKTLLIPSNQEDAQKSTLQKYYTYEEINPSKIYYSHQAIRKMYQNHQLYENTINTKQSERFAEIVLT